MQPRVTQKTLHPGYLLADELLGSDKTQGSNKHLIQNKRIYKKLCDIDKLPKRDQEALLRTINAFLASAKRTQ